jgi:hypothetical protein
MNILNFDKWTINEKRAKFDATIKSDNDNSTDEIIIESPNGDEKRIYSISDNDTANSIDDPKIENEDGEVVQITDVDNSTNTVEDKRIKKNVLRAAHIIGKIQDDMRAKEIDRLTGGDITSKTKQIINIFDENNSDKNGINLFDKLDDITKEEAGAYKYITIDDAINDSKYSNLDISKIYKLSHKSIGKGEYLLPLLFNDVYKNTIYDEDSRGDNYILCVKDDKTTIEINLEVKSPGSPMYFTDLKKGGSAFGYINDTNNNIIDRYKNAITATILNYAKNRQTNNYLYICFFTESKNTNEENFVPEGMLFMNMCNINKDTYRSTNNNIFETIKKYIRILNNSNENFSEDFKITIKMNGENDSPIIECLLNKKYFGGKRNQINKTFAQKIKKDKYLEMDIEPNMNETNITEESIILSRDNFINEYFIK